MQTKGPLKRDDTWQPQVFASWPFRWLVAAPFFATAEQWPSLSMINKLFDDQAVMNTSGQRIRAVAAPRKKPSKPAMSYDEFYEPRVFSLGQLYTRACHWHDLMNACVWATFPKSKAALNKRHFAAFCARNPLPIHHVANRSKEQDTLTLFDEGGSILVKADDEGRASEHRILFGHGAYECLVYERLNFSSAGIVLERPASLCEKDLIPWVDEALALRIHASSHFSSPGDFQPMIIEDFLVPSAPTPQQSHRQAVLQCDGMHH